MPPTASSHDALKIFISYSRIDSKDADAIVSSLEEAGFDVAIDRRDLPYGEEWQRELGDFIRAADTIVWLVSPNSIASKWCLWELGELQRLSKRLLPVVIAPVSPIDLPEALGRIHLLPAEGVYRAATHFESLVKALQSDGAWLKEHTRLADRARIWRARENSKDQLLRGSALSDAERWRDRQPTAAPRPSQDVLDLILSSRRAQGHRQRLTVAASLTAAVLAIALSLVALLQRNAAVSARDEARVAQANAEAQQKRAEGALAAGIETANGLIVRIGRKFRNRGVPNDLVREVLQEAHTLQNALFTFEANNPELQSSNFMALLDYGDTLGEFGDPAGALDAYNEALNVARARSSAAPSDAQRQREMVIALQSVASVTWRQDPAAATSILSEALGVARELVLNNPRNAEDSSLLASTLSSLADQVQSYAPDRAVSFYREAVEVLRKGVTDDPESLNTKRDLAITLQRYANVLDKPGVALLLWQESLDLLRDLAAAEPDNTDYKRDLSVTLSSIADLTEDSDPHAAILLRQEDLAILEALAAAEPENTTLKLDLALSYGRIAGNLERDDPGSAMSLYEKALKIHRQLLFDEPGNVTFQRDLTVALVKTADLLRNSDAEAAIALYEEALKNVRSGAVSDPGNNEIQDQLAVVLSKLGYLTEARNHEAALDFYRESLAVHRRLASAMPQDTRQATGLVVGLYNMALAGENSEDNLREALKILDDFDDGRLTEKQQGWIDEIEIALAQTLSSDASSLIVDSQFEQAERKAREALSLAPDSDWMKANLAHALMFQGKLDEADRIYLGMRGKIVQERPWEDVIRDEFRALRQAGLSHPHMAAVEAAFAKHVTVDELRE